jgi:hypothetical protein
MITKLESREWLVEPDIAGAREYARLSIYAEVNGLNIDGQGTISWQDLQLNNFVAATCKKKPKKK